MNKKLIFITMLIVSLALCFFSCEEPPQLSITVTGIPSTYNGKYGYIGLTNNTMDSSKLKAVAVSLPITISGGQITCDLLTKNADPFTETGTYHCTLIITSDSKGNNAIWTGVKLNLKITDVVTKIQFSQFIVP